MVRLGRGTPMGQLPRQTPGKSFGSRAVSKRETRSGGNASSFAERLIEEPKTAAAAICFASRVYSDHTRYSIRGGCCPFAIICSQRSEAPSVSHHCQASVTTFLKLRIFPDCWAGGTSAN